MAEVRIHTLPRLPDLSPRQPAVVASLDGIRFAMDDDEHAEFCWFAREYSRNYRYHLNHAAHRLGCIYREYEQCFNRFVDQIPKARDGLFEISILRGVTSQIYWDFESFLNAISAALDTLARLCGLFFAEQTPLSFMRLCAKKDLKGVVHILRSAERRWVARMKDYRDCFVHYTPVDNETPVSCVLRSNGWNVWGRLPVNPNIRETDGFRYSFRVDLLCYAVATYKHMSALDKAVGRETSRAYRAGEFPRRTRNLFFVGTRRRRVQQ